jgi:excisionase family DNA binding protein
MITENQTDAANEESNMRKEWYSVREAAAYLGVSKPTIFRWMKEGCLSFFKIGGGTRFSQEGLDAVIEKTTGQKEAEMAASRCAACGHSILVDGQLRGAGKLYFRPTKSSFWVLAEAMVPTRARVCTACGYIQMHTDVAILRRLKPKPVQNKNPGAEKAATSEKPISTT